MSKIQGSLACLLGVRIMFQIGATCLPADCSVSDLVPWRSISTCWSGTKQDSSLMKVVLSLNCIA